MNYEFDLHMHTIVSGHAYSTLQEMVKSAAEKGLKMIGITEHAYSMPGAPLPLYFHNLKVVPKEMYGVRVLKGIEANILNSKGTIDLDNYTKNYLEVVIASLHPPCIQPSTLEINTETIVNTLRNPKVDIIGHPDDSRYPLDYDIVVKEAKDNNKLLELNNSSLNPQGFREGARKNATKMLELCKQYNHPIIIGSDAHISFDVGNFDYAKSLIEEVNFPEALIMNTSVDKIKKHLNLVD
ncbi:putative hydrolase [Natranaerovirga hydrolytica]|uniref:Putative hydrolase n=1 Tax=Natranaerovirga hydrolytica TaxID=680378 RepID=A0A4R1MDU0_9FIRM|nr:phosphatase [Natranaerovirga hydrolytica]TCK90636.1 putative hydrolase [Natranaerovirga hydrolytica]